MSVKLLFSHIPFADEVNAWNIAAYVNFFDLFKVTKVEGHLLIWFLCLKPFAVNNLFYPYSMQLINWLFAFGAVILMWKFAPFNALTKFFITLSYPVMYHAMYARCYSAGLFFLFAAASIYPKRLKHPLLYSLLLILAANTSVIALIGAFVLGLLFRYDLYKSKMSANISNKTLILTLSIFLLGGFTVLAQLFNFSIPSYVFKADDTLFFTNFSRFFLKRNIKILACSYIYFFLMLSAIKFFIKSKISLIFLLFVNCLLIIIFGFVYNGYSWHFTFFYVYFIMSVWLYLSENNIDTKFQKLYMIVFLCFCLALDVMPKDFKNHNGTHEYFKEYILKNVDKYSSSKIFIFPDYSYVNEVFPYIEKYKLDIYNSEAQPLRTTEFYLTQWNKHVKDLDKIAGKMQVNETAYLWMDLNNLDLIDNDALKSDDNLKILPYECVFPVMIYKIHKISESGDR